MLPKDSVIQELLIMELKTRLHHIEDTVVTAALSAAFCTSHKAASEIWESPLLNAKQFFRECGIASWSLGKKYVFGCFFEQFRFYGIELLFSDDLSWIDSRDLGLSTLLISVVYTYLNFTIIILTE